MVDTSGLSLENLKSKLPSNYTFLYKHSNNTIVCRDNDTGETIFRHFHTDIVRYNPDKSMVQISIGEFWTNTTRSRIIIIVHDLIGVNVSLYHVRRKTVKKGIFVWNNFKTKRYAYRDGFTIIKQSNNKPVIKEMEILYRKRKLVKGTKW